MSQAVFSVADIRKTFLDFFAAKGHTVEIIVGKFDGDLDTFHVLAYRLSKIGARVVARQVPTGFGSLADMAADPLRKATEADLVPALVEYGIGLLPYYPLANGLLTGKYRRGVPAPAGTRIADFGRESSLTDETFDVVESLESFAKSRGVELLDVAIGGLAAQPAVASVIAGATSAEQVRANVAAGGWSPTAEDLEALDKIVPGQHPKQH